MAKQFIIPMKHLPAQPAVIGFANTPPTPAEGDRYIVGSFPTGEWIGYSASIAMWDKAANAWELIQPENGWRCYVTILGKEYVYFANSWGETKELVWGGDIQLQQGRYIYHRELQDQDDESDYRESVDIAEFQPYKKREWNNGENWIPRDYWFAGESIKPSTPFIFDLETWLEENILPLENEMPDKGIWIKVEIQYWMNHYYENSEAQVGYHRTLTATKVIMFNVLRHNLNDSPKYIPGSVIEMGFSGVHAKYDSYPTMYAALTNSGVLLSDAFLITVGDVDAKLQMTLEQDLQNQHSFESEPDWDVKFQFRMKVIQYSQYDRTSEYV